MASTACAAPARPPSTFPTWRAAGSLLVPEAGGRISDMQGAPHSVTASEHLLADNGGLHDQVLEIFGEFLHGQFRVAMPQIG